MERKSRGCFLFKKPQHREGVQLIQELLGCMIRNCWMSTAFDLHKWHFIEFYLIKVANMARRQKVTVVLASDDAGKIGVAYGRLCKPC